MYNVYIQSECKFRSFGLWCVNCTHVHICRTLEISTWRRLVSWQTRLLPDCLLCLQLWSPWRWLEWTLRCLRASPLNQTMTGMYIWMVLVQWLPHDCTNVCWLHKWKWDCLSTLSFNEAIRFGREGAFDGFLAVGGGSVMDSAKVANLFACYPESDLMDFVAVPHGKGKPILKQLKPLICGEPRCVRMYVCLCMCMCLCVRVYLL